MNENAFQDNFEFGLLLMGVFVLPRVHLQTAFHQEGPAFAHVLGNDFRLPAPGLHVNKTDFLLVLARLRFPSAIDGQAELATAVPLGR